MKTEDKKWDARANQRAAYWGDGREGFAVAIVASSVAGCGGDVAPVSFLFFGSKEAFALVAKINKAVFGAFCGSKRGIVRGRLRR